MHLLQNNEIIYLYIQFYQKLVQKMALKMQKILKSKESILLSNHYHVSCSLETLFVFNYFNYEAKSPKTIFF